MKLFMIEDYAPNLEHTLARLLSQKDESRWDEEVYDEEDRHTRRAYRASRRGRRVFMNTKMRKKNT